MKKVYNKPEILFERFTLNVNIAGDCEVKTWTPNSGTCAYVMVVAGRERPVFTNEVEACVSKQETGEYNGICYHGPVDQSLFNS